MMGMSDYQTIYRKTRLAAVLGLTLLLLVLIGLTIAKKYSTNTGASADTSSVVLLQGYTDQVNNPNKTFAIVVDHEKLKAGPSKITVKQGDTVRVNLRAVGEEARAKLDGYNIITESDPSDDVPGGFSFVADTVGSFKYYALSEPNPDGVTPDTQTYLGTVVVE